MIEHSPNAVFPASSFLTRLRVGTGALCLALVTATSAAAITAPRQGVLNFEPGTSIEDIKVRLENEICKGASSITITSGPEPALDPTKEQVTFQCEP